MIKNLILLVLCLTFFVNIQAQQHKASDTVYYYRDKTGNPVDKQHASDVIIIAPADTILGEKMYSIRVYYLTGKIKLIGTSSIFSYRPILEGTGVTYYPNGKKESYGVYKYGVLTGDVALFYPNGKFNAIKNYKVDRTLFVICKDSTGIAITESGNGKWMQIGYLNNNKLLSEGSVKDSLQDGEWHETINDSIKYITVYKKGVAVSSTNPNQLIEEQIFVAVEKKPEFPQGNDAFISFISRNLKFPAFDRENHIQGTVLVRFVVEKDGSLTDITAIKSPSESIANEVIRVIKASPPWRPGMQDGKPVRVRFTTSFKFSLAEVNDN